MDFEDAHHPTLGDDGSELIERTMQIAQLVKARQELEVDDSRATRIIKLKSGGLTNEEIVEAADVDVSAILFLINEPFSSGLTRLLMKCGEVADINTTVARRRAALANKAKQVSA